MFGKFLELIFYKPVVEYLLGTRGFFSMLSNMMIRFALLITFVMICSYAFFTTSPGLVTGKSTDPDPSIAAEATRIKKNAEHAAKPQMTTSELKRKWAAEQN